MKSLDCFFNKEFNEDDYNCAHFTSEVWEHLTGENIKEHLTGLLNPVRNRNVDYSKRHFFKKVAKPLTPCIIQMKVKGKPAHIGLYHNGFVIQITQKGVQNQPLEISTRGFKHITYYRTRK